MAAGADLEDSEGEDRESGGAGPDTGTQSLETFLKEKGLRTADDLVNYARNIEKKNTELGNKNRLYEVASMFPSPQAVAPAARTQRKPIPKVDDPTELFTDRDKLGSFLTDYSDAVRTNTRADIEEEQARESYAKLWQQAVQKASENPEEFQRLRPRMLELSRTQAFSHASLDDLYARAKQEEAENWQRGIEQIKQALFPGVDLSQLTAALPKARSGQISTAGGTGERLSRPMTREEAEKAIRDGILNAKLG